MVRQSLLLRLQTKLAVVMISRFLWHVMALPVEFFTQRHAGDIASRVAANEQIARLLSSGIAANALNLTSIVFFAAAMAIYDLPLAAIGVGISLMNVLALRFIGERRQDLSRSLAIEQGKLIGATVSAVRTIETLKASGLEDEAFGQWAGIQAKALNAEQRARTSSVILDMMPTLFSGLTVAAILGIGGLRVIEGSLTLGSLVAFQSLMASFSEPVDKLVELRRKPADHQGRARASRGRLQLSRRQIRQGCRRGSLPSEAGRQARAQQCPVRLFACWSRRCWPTSPSPLQPGSRVALVGASGSGKSTLGQADLRSVPAMGRRNSHRRMDLAGNPVAGLRQFGRLRRSGRLPVRGHGARQSDALGHDRHGSGPVAGVARMR